MRENAGFKIIASVPLERDIELVIGFKETTLGEQYVCWFCRNNIDYYWEKYSYTYREAVYALMKRLNDYYPGAPK